jgi:hypothetical protein
MTLTANNHSKWALALLLPFIILLLSHSSVRAQWTSVPPPTVDGNWFLTGVHFTSANDGWAVGTNYVGADSSHVGVLLRYQSGSWASVAPPTVSSRWDLNGVHFTSVDEGWAVGFDSANRRGVLLQYQNGIWTSIIPPTVSENWALLGVHFSSPNEGWAVGIDSANTGERTGALLHYQNGSWTSVTPPAVSSSWELRGVHFTSANEGWAAGRDNANGRKVLLRYVSGTWTLENPPLFAKNWLLRGVHTVSSGQGWAVGYDITNDKGTLVHLYNGVWTEVDNPPVVSDEWELYGVHFTSTDEGWAVGTDLFNDRGTLLHYQGGSDWTSVNPPDVSGDWGLAGVHFTSAAEGWAVGWDNENQRGVLLHYLAVSPNTGTIGTQITLTGVDFGIKKGKVLLGTAATKIAKDGWQPDSITCTVTKVPLPAGSYPSPFEVTIKPQPYKTVTPIIFTNAFTVVNPEIGSLEVNHAASGTEITIDGRFFSTKKGKVYLEYEKDGQLKKKNCPVRYWTMNPITGRGEIGFAVPKGLGPGTYPLRVTNKVGSTTTNFTIDSLP